MHSTDNTSSVECLENNRQLLGRQARLRFVCGERAKIVGQRQCSSRPTDRFIVSGAVQRTERIIFSSVAGAHRVPVSHTYAAALYKRMVYNFCNWHEPNCTCTNLRLWGPFSAFLLALTRYYVPVGGIVIKRVCWFVGLFVGWFVCYVRYFLESRPTSLIIVKFGSDVQHFCPDCYGQ